MKIACRYELLESTGMTCLSHIHHIQCLLREFAIQRYLYHPHICRPKGVILASPIDSKLKCGIVLPNVTQGPVLRFLKNNEAISSSDEFRIVSVIPWAAFRSDLTETVPRACEGSSIYP